MISQTERFNEAMMEMIESYSAKNLATQLIAAGPEQAFYGMVEVMLADDFEKLVLLFENFELGSCWKQAPQMIEFDAQDTEWFRCLEDLEQKIS